MKITQINGARGLILKSSIKKVIIDSDVENASAFKDVVITHLSLDTLNIIQTNSSPYRRINLSYDLMLLLQKLWRNDIIKKPEVMPKFRILPARYGATLGLEFKITTYDSDDGVVGSIAIIIEDMNTGEKLGYVPNFITQGQHKKRIKTWKRAFRDAKLNQFISFNSNINNEVSEVTFTEKDLQHNINKWIKNDSFQIQNWLKPFNPERMAFIDQNALNNQKQIIWLPKEAQFLHYYYPHKEFCFIASSNGILPHVDKLEAISQQNISSNDIVQEQNTLPIADQLHNYVQSFRNTLPQTDFTEIIKMIGAQESILI